MSEQVWLGLGANVGDALGTLSATVFSLDDVDGITVDEVSGVYRTAPWPGPEDPRHVPQDDYLNVVVRVLTTLEPFALLEEIQLLEEAFGRDRSTEVRWGPRPLDIDVLLFGDRVIVDPRLEVPHPRLAERGFVLVPLLEVAPGGVLPDGTRITTLINHLAPIEGIEHVMRLEELPTRHSRRPDGPQAPAASFTRPNAAAEGDGR